MAAAAAEVRRPVGPGAAFRASLVARVMAHLGAALEHDRARESAGWAHFERHWEEGCVLHRHLARAYAALGLQPRSAILDEDNGRWQVEPVPLDLPLAPASQVVHELMRIYEDIGARQLLDPLARCQPPCAAQVTLCSVIAVLGMRDIAPALMALLQSEGWHEGARWTRHEAPRSLGQLFEFLSGRGFRCLLARAIGARRAARCYAAMMARLVPGIGRRLLVANVLWLVVEQVQPAPRRPDGIHLGQLRPVHERLSGRLTQPTWPRPAYNH